jgi:hypothetical protein
MDNQKFEIEGLKELTEALSALPEDVQNRIIKGFLGKVGRKFIVNELRSAMPYSQTVRKGKYAGKERYRVVTDPADKNAIYAGLSRDSFWVRWADKGTEQRYTKKGWNRGSITPKNDVRTVIETQINPIIDFARDEFGNEINKSLERRIKKINKQK